jgi:predicted nucleic acid-binding protein
MTLVVDASVLVDLLLASPRAERAAALIREFGETTLHLPHLADVETASVLRAHVRAGRLSAARAASALEDLRDFPATRWPASVLLTRMWALRDNVTAYDATYIALSEALNATLVTADQRLARAAEQTTDCAVVVIE